MTTTDERERSRKVTPELSFCARVAEMTAAGLPADNITGSHVQVVEHCCKSKTSAKSIGVAGLAFSNVKYVISVTIDDYWSLYFLLSLDLSFCLKYFFSHIQ